MSDTLKALYIEDDSTIRELIAELVGDKVELISVGSLGAAREALDRDSFDVIIADLNLPDSKHVNTITALSPYFIPIIVLSALGCDNTFRRAAELGVDEYILKTSLDKINLVSHIRMARDRRKDELHNRVEGKHISMEGFDKAKPFITCPVGHVIHSEK